MVLIQSYELRTETLLDFKKNKAGEGFSNLPFFGVFKAEHVEKEVVWEIFSRIFNFGGFIFSAEKTQSPGIS